MKRVLVWGLSNNRAGTEAVIVNYVRNMPEVDFDFLCYEAPLNYEDLFEQGRNRYFVLPIKIQHPVAFARVLKAHMNRYAHEYSALWCNVNDVSNIDVLKLAARHNIPKRIVHMHNAGIPDRLITKAFTRINKKQCLMLATEYWACSREAGKYLYGNREFRIIPNMIDAEKVVFNESSRRRIREEYGIASSFVVGTLGRMADQKNQRFLIEILPRLLDRDPSCKLVIVGNGPLEADLKKLATEKDVWSHVLFVGAQEDVQGWLSAFDVFAMPSLYEGLPVALLEAQFNGLPCVLSSGISEESIISASAKRIDLSNQGDWINDVIGATRNDFSMLSDRAACFDFKKNRSFLMTLF